MNFDRANHFAYNSMDLGEVREAAEWFLKELEAASKVIAGMKADQQAAYKASIEEERDKESLILQVKKGSDQIDGLLFAVKEANDRELEQLRRFEKDREERSALVLQLRELEQIIGSCKDGGCQSTLRLLRGMALAEKRICPCEALKERTKCTKLEGHAGLHSFLE